MKTDLITQLNHGSRFVITIPKGKLSKRKNNKTSAMSNNITSNTVSLNVIVVDDEQMIRNGILALLGKWGYNYRVVDSAESAIAIIKNDNFIPQSIIVNYQLRNHKTGIEAIHCIHEIIQSAVPAIIMTGDILPENITEVKQSNFPVLFKPVKPAKIRKFLMNCVNQR